MSPASMLVTMNALKYNYRNFRSRPTVLALGPGWISYRRRGGRTARIGSEGACGITYGPCTYTFSQLATARPDRCFSVVTLVRTYDFEVTGCSDAESVVRFVTQASAATGIPTVPGTPKRLLARMRTMEAGMGAALAVADSARAWFQGLHAPRLRRYGTWSGSGGFPTCAVCLEPCREGLAELPRCGHVFHAECIEPWLASSASCPLCRQSASGGGGGGGGGSSSR